MACHVRAANYAFTAAARAAGVIGANDIFDPFANDAFKARHNRR